jgi:phosphate transport system substrate-binding protein
VTRSIRRFGPPDPRRFQDGSRRWFWVRLAIYGLVAAGILMFRVVPSLRPHAPEVPKFPVMDTSLEISGVSLAPDLIARMKDEYVAEYPKVGVVLREGGTAQSLEDLVNRRTDVAFLARPLKPEESRVIQDVGDSVSTFAIALGGIAVLASTASSQAVLPIEELRRLLSGENATRRVVAPEPNRGLWEELAARLELDPETPPPNIHWVADERAVIEEVAGDAAALGVASTLALPSPLQVEGVREVPVQGAGQTNAFTANKQEVATGEYPLFHYLYVSCRPGSGALASGFVTFLFSGRGQRLVSRAGYLPAREVPRPIRLTSRPIGSKGT